MKAGIFKFKAMRSANIIEWTIKIGFETIILRLFRTDFNVIFLRYFGIPTGVPYQKFKNVIPESQSDWTPKIGKSIEK